MKPLEFISRSETDTDAIGNAIGRCLQCGDVIALNGSLGAGKTRLVRAIVTALHGHAQDVNSPTFVIAQRYDGTPPVDHVDAYRLADVDEFFGVGGADLFEDPGICLIEWADRILEALPTDHLRIDITLTGPDSRCISLTGRGPRSTAIVSTLQTIWQEHQKERPCDSA